MAVNGALMLRPPRNQPHDIPTHTIRPPNILSTVTIFYCNTSTMWHFSTVTFWLCDNFLLRHFDHVTFFYCDIPSQSGQIFRPPQKVDHLSHCDIPTHCHFGQPMAVTFCRFLPTILCPRCRRFWQMMISWHYPFNFWTSTHRFGSPRSGRGYAKGVFFRSFFRSDTRLEVTVTFSSFPRGDFDHCDILSIPHETSQKASRWIPGDLWQKVNILLQSKSGLPVTIQVKKKGGRPITVTKRPTFGWGGS